jgi:hypothetical protein
VAFIILKSIQFHINFIALIINLFLEGIIYLICRIILIIRLFNCVENCCKPLDYRKKVELGTDRKWIGFGAIGSSSFFQFLNLSVLVPFSALIFFKISQQNMKFYAKSQILSKIFKGEGNHFRVRSQPKKIVEMAVLGVK